MYIGWKTKCRTCSLRSRCIRGKKVEVRQVLLVKGREEQKKKETCIDLMKKRFDSFYGKYIYSRRIGTVEPVFANICRNIGLNRFTLRGKQKVDIQWKLFCIVHNIGKLAKYALRFAL